MKHLDSPSPCMVDKPVLILLDTLLKVFSSVYMGVTYCLFFIFSDVTIVEILLLSKSTNPYSWVS